MGVAGRKKPLRAVEMVNMQMSKDGKTLRCTVPLPFKRAIEAKLGRPIVWGPVEIWEFSLLPDDSDEIGIKAVVKK